MRLSVITLRQSYTCALGSTVMSLLLAVMMSVTSVSDDVRSSTMIFCR